MDTEPRNNSPARYRGSGFSNTTEAFMAIVIVGYVGADTAKEFFFFGENNDLSVHDQCNPSSHNEQTNTNETKLYCFTEH